MQPEAYTIWNVLLKKQYKIMNKKCPGPLLGIMQVRGPDSQASVASKFTLSASQKF